MQQNSWEIVTPLAFHSSSRRTGTIPEVDDMLDELAMLALKTGGKVIIVPTERMPTKSGMAAIYRY